MGGAEAASRGLGAVLPWSRISADGDPIEGSSRLASGAPQAMPASRALANTSSPGWYPHKAVPSPYSDGPPVRKVKAAGESAIPTGDLNGLIPDLAGGPIAFLGSKIGTSRVWESGLSENGSSRWWP